MNKSFEFFLSLETLNKRDQIHNDIKPQNYLVKFRNNDERLSIDDRLRDIEIVLTDFGLAGSDSKGGTPVFASPECLANPDRKDKSSDIFSLGRVFLFMILPKNKFLEFLFVPIFKGKKEKMMNLIKKEPILYLISMMMRIKNRIDLQKIRAELDGVSKIKCSDNIKEISDKIDGWKTQFPKKKNNKTKFKNAMEILQNLS